MSIELLRLCKLRLPNRYVGAHVITMLLMGLVPPLMQIPFDEQISELFGHLWWLWIIEIVRHDLRYRITGYGSVEDER